jgi:hypothetical protein
LRLAEDFEELKRKVRPKLLMFGKELADVAKIFKDFQD